MGAGSFACPPPWVGFSQSPPNRLKEFIEVGLSGIDEARRLVRVGSDLSRKMTVDLIR